MPSKTLHIPDINQLISGILSGDRLSLARGITLVESRKESDFELAERLLDELIPHSGKSIRIGITGIPGVGKSTFINEFGRHIIENGRSVAVLSVDPSSSRSGGSILGDKTRMQYLSSSSSAFIRPSPSGEHLGGVTAKTRESIILCESAGYSTILVETVGIGQSESSVKGMTDLFLLMVLAGTGDELQGIKRGVMEMADLIAVNKCDGPQKLAGLEYAAELKQLMHVFDNQSNREVPVLPVSSTESTGVDNLLDQILKINESMEASGEKDAIRKSQSIIWFRELLSDLTIRKLQQKMIGFEKLELEVAEGIISIRNAIGKVEELLSK